MYSVKKKYNILNGRVKMWNYIKEFLGLDGEKSKAFGLKVSF